MIFAPRVIPCGGNQVDGLSPRPNLRLPLRSGFKKNTKLFRVVLFLLKHGGVFFETWFAFFLEFCTAPAGPGGHLRVSGTDSGVKHMFKYSSCPFFIFPSFVDPITQGAHQGAQGGHFSNFCYHQAGNHNHDFLIVRPIM